jgi:serine/threonine protein kinase/Flp pilus assembly protein TadD
MAAHSQFVGQTLSHYRILEQIGAGGMGVVYRARDEQLERDVALKVLPSGTLTDETARKRFRKEALALAKLNHPNIATVHEFGSLKDTNFLVTEYIAGLTLETKLAAGAISEKEVVDLGIQLAQGLCAAHEQGIVHRDLKPANLRLSSDGRLKILDFGLAQLIPHASAVGPTATLTQPQGVSGTLPYMAPEQLRGNMTDVRTDIWAAGIVLYEMATAHRPFEEKVPTALVDDIIHKTPLSPRSLKPTLSPQLAKVILRCLEKQPTHRYQSARELLTDLERLSTGAQPHAARRRLWPIIAASAIVVVMLAAGAFLFRRRSPRLTEKDTIVLADFINSTGDPVFDDTLRHGLSAQLEQSPFVNLLSEQRIAETLTLMAQPKDARLTHELANEVCQRTASAAVLDGSIAQIGAQYLLTLKAVNCANGESLASTEAPASDKNHVLDALGKVASEIRSQLGESLASVQKYDAPAENVTTASLEALKAYSLGYRAMVVKSDPPAAVSLFQRAISLDPNFAMAYARLGICYSNLNETARAAENTRKGYQLRERVSEREKFYIVSHYEEVFTGNLEAASKIHELWAETYPRDNVPPHNLGIIYAYLGDYDKSLAASQEVLKLNPGSGSAYVTLVGSYLYLNRLDDAKATAQEAQAHNLDSPQMHLKLYLLDFLQDDAAGMEQEAAGLMGKPGFEDQMLYNESDTAAFVGQFAKARGLMRRAAESAKRVDEKETAAGYEAEAAVREALAGNMALAKQQAQAALTLSNGRDVAAMSAIALGRAGDTRQAMWLAADLNKRFPEDTIAQLNHLPTIRAATALRGGDTGRAIEALALAAPYELGLASSLYPVYLRGEAYLAAKRGTAAAVEFQKILDHPGVVANEFIGSLAHLQLGRAYLMAGDTTQAKAAYQDFLTLWKDADPDLPILKEAKAEYAKLQ